LGLLLGKGVWLAEPAGVSRLESFPEVGKEVKAAKITEDPLVGEFRRALQAEGGIGSFECKVEDIDKGRHEDAAALREAAAKGGAGSAEQKELVYVVKCEGRFQLFVRERTVWAKVREEGGKLTVASYQSEAYRIWDASLKGKVFTIGRGSVLKVNGVRHVSGYARLDGNGYFSLDFDPVCAHEGLGCTFEDAPASIALASESCAEPLLAQKDAWLKAIDTKDAGEATAPMLSMLDVLTSGSSDVRKRLAEHLRTNKRYEELVALLVEQKDDAGLQSFGEEQQKASQPKVAASAYEGLRALKGDEPALLAKLGAAYVEAGSKGKALAVLRVAADGKTEDASHQKLVGFLLEAAGDKAAGKVSLGRACSLGDSEACTASK